MKIVFTSSQTFNSLPHEILLQIEPIVIEEFVGKKTHC